MIFGFNTIELIIFAVYIIPYLFTFRLTARKMFERAKNSYGPGVFGWDDVFFLSVGAAVKSIFWPIGLPVSLVSAKGTLTADRAAVLIGGESKTAKIKRLEQESRQRGKELAELEFKNEMISQDELTERLADLGFKQPAQTISRNRHGHYGH